MSQTLEAVATTDGLSAITNGFFKNGEMKLSAYFAQEDKQVNEKISDVNEKATLFLEISPNEIGQGFLKNGIIQATALDETENNFNFSNIKNVTIDELEEEAQYEGELENKISEPISTRPSGNTQENEMQNSEDSPTMTQETYEELTAQDFEIEIIGDNQIQVQNVIHNTKIEVEIEYCPKEEFKVENLEKKVNLKLSGTYINVNLERIETETEQEIVVGWRDSHNFEISGEYTQFSPFKLGEHTGSIVESKIQVKREIQDENYLPIKQTTIEIEVPECNGNIPETVNIQAIKLMATKGQDVGQISFGEDNWQYDAKNRKITIVVNNDNAENPVLSMGEDEYIITYKYNNYVNEESIEMLHHFKVTVEAYSANENFITTKELSDRQTIKSQVNDLITYQIVSTKEALNTAKINANYQSEQPVYESEFTTTVNINLLTNDLLEELKINSGKEVYVTKDAVEFNATPDIYYNKIKFNYNEISPLLQNGGCLEIQNMAGELLYTLDSQHVQNQENCEIRTC